MVGRALPRPDGKALTKAATDDADILANHSSTDFSISYRGGVGDFDPNLPVHEPDDHEC